MVTHNQNSGLRTIGADDPRRNLRPQSRHTGTGLSGPGAPLYGVRGEPYNNHR